MINKVLMSGYDDSGKFPIAAIIPQFKNGLDRDTLKKRASIFDAMYDKFERKPKHTYIHLISVAAGEYYGPNARADFYNGDSYCHEFPQPEEGGPKFIILKRGLEATHNATFMKNGAPYTEHFSSLDGAKPQGYIVHAAINPEMHRGELIIGVETDKWADDIEKLENGTPMKFSIGASAPYDICSICGRKATTEKMHCDHYKQMPGAILEDGSQVYVISDNCVFHDISRVKNPAEKIAFSIRKVASGNVDRLTKAYGPTNVNVVRDLCKTASSKNRFDMLSKLAAIEKEIIAEATNKTLDPALIRLFSKKKATRKALKKSASENLNSFLKVTDPENILCSCTKHDYIMSPEEFVDLMLPEEDKKAYKIDSDKVTDNVKGIFGKILHSEDADTFCNDDTYECDTPCKPMTDLQIGNYCKTNGVGDVVGALVADLLNNTDLQSENKRIIINISNKSIGDTNEAMARDYASYLVSSALRSSPECLTTTLLRNILE